MPPECYKVEVLHFLNPHLIWIEVIDLSVRKEDNFAFEQIGIYGILPVEPMLDVVEENLKTRITDEWLPATSATLQKALTEAQEIWFCPTYIDRRSSIFDDNIHKYGELLLRKSTEKLKPLSKILIKSGFAVYDTCLFHQELGSGKIITKLQSCVAKDVIKNIENYYMKKKTPRKDWEKLVKTQTVVTRTSQQLESALTAMNLEKHNTELMTNLLQNKIKDFEMCKGADEEPIGRAYKLKQKRSNREAKTKESISTSKELNLKSTLLKKKLELTLSKKSYSQDLVDRCNNNTEKMLAVTKKFLESNVCKENLEKDRTSDKNQRIYMTPANTLSTESNGDVLSKMINNHSNFQQNQESRNINRKGSMLENVTRKQNVLSCNEKKVGYGPPGIDFKKLSLKLMTDSDQQHTVICHESIDETNLKEDMYANVDSHTNVEITNKNILKDIEQDMNVRQKYDRIRKNSSNCGETITNKLRSDKTHNNESSSDIANASSGSKVLQKKLMLHQEMTAKTLNSSVTSCSDTTNKDSSSSLEEIKVKQREKRRHLVKDSDDEDIDEIIKKINEEYPVTSISRDLKYHHSDRNIYNCTMKNCVNPFKNIDPNISLFVDKLVTPVLMVHTKMNKRIEPVFNLRDVHFNSHIQVVLKNMSIERPMILQTITWFCILRGYSMFMVSPVGSGKTLGYLPAVCRLVSDSGSDTLESVGPTCIIVCATAKSVGEVEKMAKMFLGVQEKVLSCFAGVDESYVMTSLLNGCDLLICTPSFLARLLQLTDFGVDLRRLATVVLDDCERLAEVYSNEVKYFLFRIKDTLKNRTNKELKVQYILASRYWCDFMEPIAKKAPYSVVCIGAFQECVLYSKAGMSVNFVQQDNKVNAVHDFLNQMDMSKRTVIVCRTNDEIMILKKALAKYKNSVFACDSTMTIQDLYNLRVAWDDYEDPLLGPILLCCDDTLTHMNITNAHCLVNFSLPPLFSTFCKRFSVLNDNYPSIFKSSNDSVKIKILIEENNMEQLPKMLNYIKRFTDDIPQYLNKICNNVLAEKDVKKAANLVPICDNLLAFGYCPDFWNCLARHTVLKEYDHSKEWIPTTGQITFKILHYHRAVHFSARLLSNAVKGTARKYSQTYSTLSLKMGMYYSKVSNRKPHGIPKIGDVCAVSIKQNFFARCQVMKILSNYQRGNPNCVLIKLIDEEKLETTRDVYLYYLPDEFVNIETHVIQVRLANIQPKDKDVTFSDLARNHLKKITDKDEDMYIRGQVVMALGNCVFVETLEACQDLSSLSRTVVKHDLKRDLLEKHAILNMDHMVKVKELCVSKINIKEETEINVLPEHTKTLPQGTWAYLDNDNTSLVFFGSAISPDKFFVRLEKFESCLNQLLKEIQKYVAENPEPLRDVKESDMVLAMFPDDATYERARIDAIVDTNKVKCFFVDHGDWREVSVKHLAPIKKDFITKMPFQAIECRLVGVKPAGNEWTDFSTNWFCDKCYDDDTDRLKHLYVKLFAKEKAEFTGGNKYGVVMIDTNGEQDVIINQLLIDVNMAQENLNEIKYFDGFRADNVVENKANNQNFVNKEEVESFDIQINHTSPLQTLFKQPIRSVPLVGSDSDDSDDDERWNINMTEDFMKIFKPPHANPEKSEFKSNLPAITRTGTLNDQMSSVAGKQSISYPKVTQSRNAEKELDSDDYTSPETSESVCTPEKRLVKSLSVVSQMRKPKLIWRQNKIFVFIKINLIGLEMYDLKIDGRKISFTGSLNKVEYAFDFELYGAIDVSKSCHCNKGQYILVKLSKILNKNWLTLTKDGEIRKWIVYDVESIDASSDEEVVQDNEMLNVIKNIYNQDNSGSEEDEDFMDDINFRRKSYKAISLD